MLYYYCIFYKEDNSFAINIDMSNKEKDKKQVIFTFFGIIIFIVVGVLVYFSSKSYIDKNKKNNEKITNTITLNYVSKSNDITVSSKQLFSDVDAKLMTSGDNVFDFSVSSVIKGGKSCNYEIVVSKDLNSTIPDDKVRIYLQRATDGTYSNADELLDSAGYIVSNDLKLTKDSAMLLDKGEFGKSKTVYYRLRVWIDSTYVPISENDFYKLKVNIYGDM